MPAATGYGGLKMAVAELSRAEGVRAEATAAQSPSASESEIDVRLDVHDASRLEWSAALPLPDRSPLDYEIELELEIPANVFARHSPWDQLQSWARLDGPEGAVRAGEGESVDGLRRGAVAFAHKLARANEGFARHCRLAGQLSQSDPCEEIAEGLRLWVGMAMATVQEARARLAACKPSDGVELAAERALVDEYVSVRFVEMLAGAERSLAALASSRHAAAYVGAIADAEKLLAAALAREIAHRQARRYVSADPAIPGSLELYLERASRLKKHFQEVLFLEPETFQVAERMHHWVSAFVAILASTWAFAWQVVLANQKPTTESKVGSGLVVVAVVAGLVYAAKDRIKELGRAWISGNVHRFYAQRVARWRTPARRLRETDVVLRARESFDQRVCAKPDLLNPGCGVYTTVTVVRYTHRGTVTAQPALVAGGLRRVKHIFRYDLTPLLPRLDDAVKKVPVLDDVTRHVCFVDAPRVYRVPVRLRVTCAGEVSEEGATLVLHKRGLDRLERARSSAGVARAAALETGVVP
jgi:hypothetical protein